MRGWPPSSSRSTASEPRRSPARGPDQILDSSWQRRLRHRESERGRHHLRPQTPAVLHTRDPPVLARIPASPAAHRAHRPSEFTFLDRDEGAHILVVGEGPGSCAVSSSSWASLARSKSAAMRSRTNLRLTRPDAHGRRRAQLLGERLGPRSEHLASVGPSPEEKTALPPRETGHQTGSCCISPGKAKDPDSGNWG
jgi:hypothetical protein